MVKPLHNNQFFFNNVEIHEKTSENNASKIKKNTVTPQLNLIPNQPDIIKNKKVSPIDYHAFFLQNLKQSLIKTEDLEKKAQRNETIMKALFIGLLILGIVCAASFFLLPLLGTIAGALALSVTSITIIWQAIFLGGGLIAGLSFLPHRFIKVFEENKNSYRQKANDLKELIKKNDFKSFLASELNEKYTHPEIIVSNSDFAELYYLLQSLKDKNLDIEKFNQELEQLQLVILASEENKKLSELEEKMQEMQQEVHEIENEINDLRSNLIALDRTLTSS